ncbi:MAG: DUF459 domain-containing protein [Pseudomonadota bacterium]
MSYSNKGLRAGSYAVFLFIFALCQACAPINAQDVSAGLFSNSAKNPNSPKLPVKPRRTFDADNPAKILVIGDSLGDGVGYFLRERVKKGGINATVINTARNSTGLTRTDFYNWPANFTALAARHVPDIVVIHVGANDMQGIVRPGQRVPFRTPEWDVAYREEIRKILKIAADNKAMLYWLGPGPDRNPNLNRHLAHVNPLFKAEAEASNAVYMPISKFAAQPTGGYLRTITIDGKSVTIRSGDGSHFTGIGYTLIADKLLAEMQKRAPSMFGTGSNLFAALQ